ncbi:MAG: hypothetical protein QOF58_5466 [Pseudonocardiales bacterium]|jgi:lysine/ornithine N-monooxygenase|nr:hypothetical protein [Pseudonocardiales bacterium]
MDRSLRSALCQVVGFGPAALGVAVAADRRGALDQLLAEGLVFFDRCSRRNPDNGRRLPYLIDSNSAAIDFLSGVREGGAFTKALHGRAGQLLRKRASLQVPLAVAGEFMDDLAEAVTALSAGVVEHAEVAGVHRDAEGNWTTVSPGGVPLATSRAVVLATGGHEETDQMAKRHRIPVQRLVPSGELLRGRAQRVVDRLRTGGRVVVLGGSHSGFAAAGLLLDRLGDAVPRHGVVLVHRALALAHSGPPQIEHAALDWETCHETGMINRFHGLRGAARDLCLRALAGQEDRLLLCESSTPQASAALAEADLVVHAAGYRTRQVPVFDVGGRRMPLRAPDGTVHVDDGCRVMGADGVVVPRLYGLGIGYAQRDANGRRRVGINVFHGGDADRIVGDLCVGVG